MFAQLQFFIQSYQKLKFLNAFEISQSLKGNEILVAPFVTKIIK